MDTWKIVARRETPFGGAKTVMESMVNLSGLMSKPEKDTSEKTFIRTCKLCGREFIAPTNNTMRCPECRKVMRQQQSAASYKRFLTKMEMRKMREKTTQGGVTAEKKKDGVPISYWSAALNMLAWKAGLSYGKIQVWAQFHSEEYGKWMHELRLSYEKAAEDGTLKDGIVTLPSYMPESLPRRATPLPHGWSTEKHIIGK